MSSRTNVVQRLGLTVASRIGERLSCMVHNQGVSRVAMPVGVGPTSVHSDNECLVLDCPGLQQCSPRFASRFGPVGHVDRQVVRVGPVVSHEGGKAQVVADLKEDAPTPPGHFNPVDPCLIGVVLSSQREQVPLVVMPQSTFGGGKPHAVVGDPIVISDRHAADKGGLMAL